MNAALYICAPCNFSEVLPLSWSFADCRKYHGCPR